MWLEWACAGTGHRHTREAWITLLWPELEPGRARAGQRRNLSTNKKALGGEWLVVDRETVGLDPDADLWFDVAQLRGLLQVWQEHGHAEGEICPECLSALAEALQILDAPGFLEGEDVPAEGLSVLDRIERGRIVGRESELGTVRALWRRTLAGQGQLLLVSGEPGVARFDVVQQQDDPTRFVLVEVYRTKADPGRHKQTAHYAKWRDTVAEMMAEPRSGVKYDNVFPGDDGWG